MKKTVFIDNRAKKDFDKIPLMNEISIEKLNSLATPYAKFIEEQNLSEERKLILQERIANYELLFQLRKVRQEKGLTQSQVANKSGIPRSAVSEIESGKKNVTINTLASLAHAMGKKLEVRLVDQDEVQLVNEDTKEYKDINSAKNQ